MGHTEDFLKAIFELVYVVVDEVLFVEFSFVDKADESEAFVDLAQVENDVFLVTGVVEPDRR